jgi:FK506-binding nuclear protein
MAAIDPTQEPVGDSAGAPRVTLKIIRSAYGDFDEEEEYSDDDDVEAIKRRLGIEDGDFDEDSDEELVNGGPSDPEKTKQARKEALLKALKEDEEDDIDMDDTPNGVNGINKGKAKLVDMDDDSELSEDSDDAGVSEFVVCTLDPQHVCNLLLFLC